LAKALVITEKPSVARDITASLGGFEDHDGYWENDEYVVTFAVGHLFELLAPEEIDPEYKRWTLANLPIIPEQFALKKKKGHSDRINTIKKLLARDDVDGVVNACDAGREGELIFREIVEFLGSEKPIRRLWLQSMTKNAIRTGFDQLRPGEELDGLAGAAQCRAWSDWLIGMNATRALTKRFKGRRERGAWSAGRVQTPTLAILVGRELEVLAHVPRPYWRVVGQFEHEGNAYTGTWFDPAFRAAEDDSEAKEDRIFEEARAHAIVAKLAGRPATARETRKPSRESAPPLFDLTSLQREGNRRFGWSARRVLNAAQRCYEGHKILTYPRTDSRCLPNDYRETVDGVLQGFAEAQGQPLEGMADYARSARHLQEAGLENTKRIFDDAGVSDHFAVIPTGVIPGPSLSGDDKRLFDLVVRRFLAAFHPPAVWERVERVTELEGESFRTRARSLQVPGWRSALATPEGDEEAETLAPLAPDQTEVSGVAVATRQVEAEAEATRPPPRITEARLLSLMENAGRQIEDEDLAKVLHEKGIGTPATRAEIIENLIAKGYAVRAGKALRPTVKGIRLIDSLKRVQIDRLASPQLTGELESHLLDVERGRRTPEDFIAEIKGYASEIVERAKTFEYEEMYGHEPPVGQCPFSGRDVVEQAWFYTCRKDPDLPREAKADPDCKLEGCPLLLWKDTSGRYLDRASARTLLEEGKTGTLEGFMARSGRLYRGHLEIEAETGAVKVRSEGYDEGSATDQPEYEVNPEPLARCPFGEECAVVESPGQFVCERTLKEAENGKDEALPKSCGFVLPRTVCKREITREEAEVYLATGRTEILTDFTSRYGRPFSATLVLRKNGRHGFEFPPRQARGAAKDGDDAKAGGKKTPTRKKAPSKKTTRKKKPTRKKKTVRRKAATGKATQKTTALDEQDASATEPKKPARKKKTPTKTAAPRRKASGRAESPVRASSTPPDDAPSGPDGGADGS
jgi:DNA topoisomerase-3